MVIVIVSFMIRLPIWYWVIKGDPCLCSFESLGTIINLGEMKFSYFVQEAHCLAALDAFH